MQTVGVLSLYAWDLARATTLASQSMAKVDIVKEPLPPILNNAQIGWVGIYVGKKEYRGGKDFVNQYTEPNEDSIHFDLHFLEARKLENDPLLKKLVEAYDADCAETLESTAD